MAGAELCTTGEQKQSSVWLQQSEGEGRGVLKEIQIWEMMVKSMDLISRSEWYDNLPLKDAMFIDQAFSLIQE